MNWSRIVPDTIRSIIAGQRPIIRSDGTFIRDYIYVKDISRAYMRLAKALDDANLHGEAFNFSLERPMTVLDLVGIITELMECSHIEPEIQNITKCEIHSQFLDSTKAHTILNWQPEYSLEHGLKETIAWYRTYLS